MFFGHTWIFDGVPSELYNLYIRDLEPNAVSKSMGSNSFDIYDQKLYRRPIPYWYGMSPSSRLSFSFSAYSPEEIDSGTMELVQKWLFSNNQYKKFQVDQEDLRDTYWMAVFNQPQIVRIGNKIYGFEATIECNAPYAFCFPKTTTYTFTEDIVDSTQTFYNGSDETSYYLFPKLVITINNIGDDISITNLDDDNRVMSLFGLSANEVITMDCDLQTISSSMGLKRLSLFNKHFLRLVPGRNRLRMQGNIASIVMTTQFISKRISG